MTYWFHAEARREILESVRYYESQQSGLGHRFLEAVTDAVSRIQTRPSMYHLISGTWRQCRVARFPFGVIYRLRNDSIEIVPIMHLHRKPGYWQNRATSQ